MSERQRHGSASPWEPRVGFSRAARVGERVLVAGTAPIGRDGETVGVGDPYAQAKRCLVVVQGLLQPEWVVEMEPEAVVTLPVSRPTR